MNTDINAPFVIRSYLWEVLKLNTDMKESDYDGMVPIIPLGQAPEMERFNSPYIVYGYAEGPTEENYACVQGNMTFVIYSTNFNKLSRITNIMSRVFERQDDAAKDINEYTSTNPAFLGIRFGYIENSYVEGGVPESEEGGRVSSLVGVRYEYYANYNIVTSLATWNPTLNAYIKNATP